jgi:hypothetical protein
MARVPGQSSRAGSRAQDPVCGTLTTVVRSWENFLCIWLALVASVLKGIRRVWARSPSAHAEVMGTKDFTALWEMARDLYNRARRRKGDSTPERGSFHKGLVLLCRDKYDELLACMQIVDNTDELTNLSDSDIPPCISFTTYI